MFKKLELIKKRYQELEKELEKEEVLNNKELYYKKNKEFSDLRKINDVFEKYKKIEKNILDVNEILKTEKDAEMIALMKEELKENGEKKKKIIGELKIILLPKDPNDRKNIILEMRAGAGGDEASIFVRDLFESYKNYAIKRNWKIDIMSISEGNVGGYKEIITNISGEKVYSFLKYESGVHRVQRIPKTESQGRVHTSTITTVVLPEIDPAEVKIKKEDLRIDTCRSSGAGGQHVNTTDSAVRILHLPTNIMVYCQDGKSQHANKDRALKILYARIFDYEQEKIKKEKSKQRQKQMGTGDRSQRIRTYNFPQSRLTDHRISFTSKNLPNIMLGDMDELFEALIAHYQTIALQEDK